MTSERVNVNGHNWHCQCAECQNMVADQFKPFFMLPWEPIKGEMDYCCPNCDRIVPVTPRGGFLTWSCWECNAIDATVKKLKDGFGFATLASGDNVYFHFNRFAIIGVDDDVHTKHGGHPYLEEVPPDTYPEFSPPLEGDTIILQIINGVKGPKALWWSYMDLYESALEQIKNRAEAMV